MKRIKVSEATPRALDWLVAKCEGIDIQSNFPGWMYIPNGKRTHYKWCPSTNPKQGQPILERVGGLHLKNWLESKPETRCEARINNQEGDWVAFGPTMLIAGLRCFIASRLGDEAEVPEELP